MITLYENEALTKLNNSKELVTHKMRHIQDPETNLFVQGDASLVLYKTKNNEFIVKASFEHFDSDEFTLLETFEDIIGFFMNIEKMDLLKELVNELFPKQKEIRVNLPAKIINYLEQVSIENKINIESLLLSHLDDSLLKIKND